MSSIIDAVYEGGLFRPTEQVELAEGTHVEVHMPRPAAPRDPKTVAAKLAALGAAAPRKGTTDSAGRDHDRILYGGTNQP
jgi:predicted DNA-binding antitoxin AbrB/MazE fold protein